jgi:hypothetical protein
MHQMAWVWVDTGQGLSKRQQRRHARWLMGAGMFTSRRACLTMSGAVL